MILLLLSVVAGIVLGMIFPNNIPSNIVTVLLMFLVFFVGIEIGNEEKIFTKIKKSIPLIIIQSLLTIIGSLIFGGLSSVFTDLTFIESMGASAGFGWYSLSGVMISKLYSPLLGAISFTSNVIRELLAILLIPLLSRSFSYGSISIAGATSMDTLLGLISKNNPRENTVIAFGQGVLLSLSVPLVISIIFGK